MPTVPTTVILFPASFRATLRHPEFRIGARHMAALSPGIAAWGLMTGVAMVKSGMSLPACCRWRCSCSRAARSSQPCR